MLRVQRLSSLYGRTALSTLLFSLSSCSALSAIPDAGRISGKILDPQGAPVAKAHVKLVNAAGAVSREAISDEQGNFILDGIDPGEYKLAAEDEAFVTVVLDVSVAHGEQKNISLKFRQLISVLQAVTVVASAPSSLTPDPAQTIVIHDQVLDANPGRPGAPISIPGLPIETASGGLKRLSTLHPELLATTVSQSPNSFRSAISFIPTISQQMRMGMVIPIQTC